MLVVAVVAVVLLGDGRSAYALHAQFADAGQLVVGDQVQLGGRPIGSVTAITITPNGLADVGLKISDHRFAPLHVGTTAQIGSPGLSGEANRFVRLDPGPGTAEAIADGGVLDVQHTQGIVDLDELIDGLDAPSRMRLKVILRKAALVFAGRGGHEANKTLALLDPALSQSAALGSEIVSDQAELRRLIGSTADVSTTLAAHRGQLGDAITGTAATLREVAGRRAALEQALVRAPGVLTQARGTLRRTRSTLVAVDPTVRDLRPNAPLVARLLRQVGPVARDTSPALTQVSALLPEARKRLAAFPATSRTTVPALASVTRALTGLEPIVRGLRPYTPDLIAGFFEGFLGNTAGNYDANGHFTRVQVSSGAGSVSGLGTLLAPLTAAPGTGVRSGLVARCPGAGTDPAADGSNPYVPADSPGLCSASGQVRARVRTGRRR